MTTLECKDCGRKFTKPSAMQAQAALRMHVGRKHSGLIPTALGPRGAALRQNGSTALTVLDAPRVDRRTKAYRDSQRPTIVEAQGGDAPCFCPRCGLNLAVLTTALKVASHMSPR